MTVEAPLDGAALDELDGMLASAAERIHRTRKGRVWDIWIRERPMHVSASPVEPEVQLSAGCNSAEDYSILASLAEAVANTVGGTASEPRK